MFKWINGVSVQWQYNKPHGRILTHSVFIGSFLCVALNMHDKVLMYWLSFSIVEYIVECQINLDFGLLHIWNMKSEEKHRELY